MLQKIATISEIVKQNKAEDLGFNLVSQTYKSTR